MSIYIPKRFHFIAISVVFADVFDQKQHISLTLPH